MTLRPPPADPTELSEFPVKVVTPGFPYVRIHRQHREAEWFCTCGDCRFDPLPADAGFGTCYLSGHPLGAFIEKFGELEVLPAELVTDCVVTSMMLAEARLADVTDRQVLGRWGLSAEIGAGDDYPGSQLWALRLWQAGFAGIWYQAKHDPRSDLHSIALFGKPGLQPSAVVSLGSTPMSDELVAEAERLFGVQVFPASAL